MPLQRTKKWACLIAFWAALARPAAADVSVSASIDKARVSLNDSVRLSVVVQGSGNLPAPQMPDLSAFTVYSSGRSQNISFINGQMSSSISHNYLLTPKTVGSFAIGPFSVNWNGQTFQSEPLQIIVEAGPPQSAQAPPPGAAAGRNAPGAFIQARLDKNRAFLNQEVILSFRFYHRVSLTANPEYKPPDLAGFVYEDLPPPRNFVESVQGVSYRVTEIKTALFPTQTGKLLIPPAFLKIRVEDVGADPFSDDFFAQFFGGGGRAYQLKTEPLPLTVLPLPQEKRPGDFSGGVGAFKISAALDKREGAVGEPVTLTVSVEGSGNIKSLGDPAYPEFPGFRKYDTASSLNLEKSQGRVTGSKIYKIILVPQASGIQTLPAVAFSFFDPHTHAYKTVRSSPIAIEIKPGRAQPSAALRGAPAGIQKMRDDIAYIKLDGPERKPFRWLHERRWFAALNLLPILVLGASAAFRWRTALLEKDPELRRRRTAYRRAKKGMEEAGPLIEAGRADQSAAALLDALQRYVADKMSAPPSGLTLKAAVSFLEGSQLPASTAGQFRRAWQDLELARYAPAQYQAADLQKMQAECRDLLGKMEAHFKRFPAAPRRAAGIAALAVCLACSAAGTFAQDPADAFRRANGLYQKGRFQEALQLYSAAREQSGPSFALEYNLGNAHYKLGDRGRALAHWMRAWRMRPRQPDVRHNLALVSEECGDPFFAQAPVLRWLGFSFHALNLNELSLFWLFLLWTAAAFWSLDLLLARPLWTGRNALLACMLLCFGSWTALRLEDVGRNWAFVLAPEAEVRSGPGTQFGVGFRAPEGRRVRVLSELEDSGWTEIGAQREGLKGWVEKNAIVKAGGI